MLWARQLAGTDLIVIPQGGGKSVIIAHFAHLLNQDILILQPSRELLSQNLEKLRRYVPESEIGIYSASFGKKDIRKFTFATIQSAYKHPEQFAHYKIVLLDECDLLNPKNFDGMYNQFFRAIGAKVYGLTATPYRLDTIYEKRGYFYTSITTIKMINRYANRVWDRMLYVMNTRDLLEQDYLAPLKYTEVELLPHDQIPLNKSKSDFDLEAYTDLIGEEKVKAVLDEAKRKYKSIVVFCPTISAAERYNQLVTGGMVVSSMTPRKERIKSVEGFRTGKYQVAFNVGILTTGFDHPEIDCIILLRPTRSLRLYAQMIGRGTRKCEGKEFCTIIDMTGTVKALGRLESIKVRKLVNAQGTPMWNVVSETVPDGFHYRRLYEFEIHSRPSPAKLTQNELF